MNKTPTKCTYLNIQQYLLQQMHNFIFIQSKLAYMFRPIRPSSGQQSLGIPRIQFCQNKQITLKVVWYVAICKMSCVCVIDNDKSCHSVTRRTPTQTTPQWTEGEAFNNSTFNNSTFNNSTFNLDSLYTPTSTHTTIYRACHFNILTILTF